MGGPKCHRRELTETDLKVEETVPTTAHKKHMTFVCLFIFLQFHTDFNTFFGHILAVGPPKHHSG